jgi:hypothetical protein
VKRKVSDAGDDYVPLVQYKDWADEIERQLVDATASENRVFQRYANRVTAPTDSDAEPINILLDLSDAVEAFQSDSGNAPTPESGLLAYKDFCADVTDGKFTLHGLDGKEVDCSVKYIPKTQRYQISSPQLNERHPPRPVRGRRRLISLTEKINVSQSFRLLTKDARTVYLYGDFMQTRDVLSGSTVLPLECATAIPELSLTVSEKGETFFNDRGRWSTDSVFGLFKSYCERPGTGGVNLLEQLLRNFDLVLLDDDSSELGDFIAIGEDRCAIVHAKANEDVSSSSVTALQAVGRQAISSLAFCSSVAQVGGISDDRWQRDTIFNQARVALSRVFRNERNLRDDQIADKVRRTLTNPSTEREIWIVVGRLFDVDLARRQALDGDLSNHQRQLLMFLTSMNTACGRANAQLRVFGHPSPPQRQRRSSRRPAAAGTAGAAKPLKPKKSTKTTKVKSTAPSKTVKGASKRGGKTGR